MIAAVLAALVMVAFAWGRWTAESGPAAGTALGHARVLHPPASRFAPPAERFSAYPGPLATVRSAPIVPALAAPPAPPPAPAPSRPGPELVSRVAEEATRVLESARPELAARCVPAEGLADEGARLTFNVTFDASGREIARGISEDRRARATGATAVASCLRKLPIGSLRVAPPGTNVAVRVAMSFP
jgi:hypothetical protein